MARNDQRRQKKLEAKRSKRKEQQRDVARLKSTGIAERLLAGSRWLIAESRISDSLWENGIGYAVLVRRGPGGIAAMSMFLLDVYCLGVKDVVTQVESDNLILSRLSYMSEHGTRWRNVPPEYIRKLVECSIHYALDLGLAPHRECAAAMKLFGDIDAGQCAVEFEFGCEGKPRYVTGPYDSGARIQTVIDTLQRTCGPDGFHYFIQGDSPFELSGIEDYLGEDDDDDEDTDSGS